MKEIKIDIGKQFSKIPSGITERDGPFNGTTFREKFLIPALENNEKVCVIIDTAEAYGSSFLEEAFGKLTDIFSIDEIKNKLFIIYDQPVYQLYAELIWRYINKFKPIEIIEPVKKLKGKNKHEKAKNY